MRGFAGLAVATLLWTGAAQAESDIWWLNYSGAAPWPPSAWTPVSPTNPLPVGPPQLNTYSAAVANLAIQSGATDVLCINGAANKLIKIQGIRISGTAGSNTVSDTLVIKRSTLDTAGTSSAVTAVPHDSSDAAASATLRAYTANPTLGTAVGTLRAQSIILAGSSAPNLVIEWALYQFSVYTGQVPTLRAANEAICVNMNATAISSGLMDIDLQWTEQNQ